MPCGRTRQVSLGWQGAGEGCYLGRWWEDRDEQAGQDDSRAAGPPPNNTSSQLGRRLRGGLLGSSVSDDCWPC
ncbi:hypothetical protein Adu01nite_50020 [Paractinoplanes durhamensis]|uniref:Uncharacterized protein n=1 Tax=Paractinoplanes durhamensis TaxID=113563 RepID=A0ABQ3Z1F0_9ACTN|nr:hypothetical protein Adu01nite_50020 [Actinoplanes durhamensis]